MIKKRKVKSAIKKKIHHRKPAEITHKKRRKRPSAFSGLGFNGVQRDMFGAEMINIGANVVLRIANNFLFGKGAKTGVITFVDTTDALQRNAVMYLILNMFGAYLPKGKVMTGVHEIVRTRLSDAIIDKFGSSVDFLSNDFKGDNVDDVYEDDSGKKYIIVGGKPIPLTGNDEEYIEYSGNDLAYGGNDLAYGSDTYAISY